MAIALQVRDRQGNCRSYEAEQQVSIGRDPAQATVVLENDYVSRLHCVIQRRNNGQWILIHRGRNPSWVNGRDLRRPGEQAILPERAALTVGGVDIELHIDEDVPAQVLDLPVVLELGEDEPLWSSEGTLEEPGQELDDSDRTLLDEEIPQLSDEEDALADSPPALPEGMLGGVRRTLRARVDWHGPPVDESEEEAAGYYPGTPARRESLGIVSDAVVLRPTLPLERVYHGGGWRILWSRIRKWFGL